MAFARPACDAFPNANFPSETSEDKKVKLIGLIIMIGLFAIGFGLFFGIRNPQQFIFGC